MAPRFSTQRDGLSDKSERRDDRNSDRTVATTRNGRAGRQSAARSPPSPLPTALRQRVVTATATATLHVSTSGVDGSGCGATTAPCATLSYAVSEANLLPTTTAVTVAVAAGSYASSSCNGSAVRDVAISGSGGSSAVLFDCEHSGRLLTTNASVAITGLTVTRARVCANGTDTTPPCPVGVPNSDFGGGAVLVVWPSGVRGVTASFTDVVLVDNAVVTTAAVRQVGGGAVAVTSTGTWSDVDVSFVDCVFTNNSVVCADCGLKTRDIAGGAVLVAACSDAASPDDDGGVQGSDTCAALSGTNVTVRGSAFRGNWLSRVRSAGDGGGGGMLVFLPGTLVTTTSFEVVDVVADDNDSGGQ